MTNMVPQAPDNNQGYWADLEDYARELVSQGKELYIIAGSYGFQGTLKSKVTVPARLFKIIVVTNPGTGVSDINQSTRMIVVDTPNDNGNRQANWRSYLTTVDAIEKKTGYDFLSNISPQIQAAIESKVDGGGDNLNNSSNSNNSNNLNKCDRAYPDACIPPPPPDLSCSDIPYRNFRVLPPDPHNFDGNKDGIACTSR